MKIDFVSNNFTGNLIVTVFNIEDIFEVEKALEFIVKSLTMTWITSTKKSALRLTTIMNTSL